VRIGLRVLVTFQLPGGDPTPTHLLVTRLDRLSSEWPPVDVPGETSPGGAL
jgi:hypothetical protein